MIYDCFLFFNELDVLDLHLGELDPVVDRFVLVESTRTFTNKPKPLYFSLNKQRFERYLSKITHIVVDDIPEFFPENIGEMYTNDKGLLSMIDKNPMVWAREFFQRNAIARGLQECHPDDLILIGDVDEIVAPHALQDFSHQKKPAVFKQQMYVHYLNTKSNTDWYGTKAILFQHFTTAQHLRFAHVERIIDPGGWHFSTIGNEKHIVSKLESFSHQELYDPKHYSADKIRLYLELDINYLSTGYTLKTVDVDTSFPLYLQKNKEHFRSHLKPLSLRDHFSKKEIDMVKEDLINTRQQLNTVQMAYDSLLRLRSSKRKKPKRNGFVG